MRNELTLRSAFGRMAGWAELLPSWCDRDEPVAAALQAAAFIEILAHERDRLDDVREQPNWLNFLLADLKDIDLIIRLGGKKKQIYPHAMRRWLHWRGTLPEEYQVSETPRRALRAWQIAERDRKREMAGALVVTGLGHLVNARAGGRYVIRAEDIAAAQTVIDYCASVLADRDKRRRQRSRVTDEVILGSLLIQHRTLRNSAAMLRLSKSTLWERLKAALLDIGARVCPFVAEPVPTARPDKSTTQYDKILSEDAIEWICRRPSPTAKRRAEPLSHVPTEIRKYRCNVPKETIRAGLNVLVDEFLARGGKITKLPAGKPGKDVSSPYCPDSADVQAQQNRDTEDYLSGENGSSRFSRFAGDRAAVGRYVRSLLDDVAEPKTDEARDAGVTTREAKAVDRETGKPVDLETFTWRKAA
jgi:hypothetical protein